MDAEIECKYISRFQPRVSKHVAVSQDACIECHIDLFGMDKIGKVAGGMNAHTADFTALCAPEALPERIGLCSYFIEYAFVHDGECNNIDSVLQRIGLPCCPFLDVSVDAVQGAKTVSRRHGLDIEMILGLPFSPGKCLEGNKTLSKALGPERYEDLRAIMDGGLKRKQSRAKIWSALREIDQDYLSRCQSTFKQWYETGRQMRDQTFASLENYLAVRALDCGAKYVLPIASLIYCSAANSRTTKLGCSHDWMGQRG
jgi:hypothetical protein